MKYKQNIIKWNLGKYNYNKDLYNKNIVNILIENEKTHLTSTFKDYLLYYATTEYLKNYYSLYISLRILIPLLYFYGKSHYTFPNYNVIDEKEYIYKNIIRKQKLIYDIEDIKNKKNKDIFLSKMNKDKNKIKNSENDIIFNSQLYNNIINNDSNSNINILFGIKIKNNIKHNSNKENKENIENMENESINKIQKLIKIINESNTKSVGINTIDSIFFDNKKINKNKKRNFISSKGISLSTYNTSNVSISNLNSIFKIGKTININNLNKNNDNSLSINSNKNFNSNNNTKKTFKLYKKTRNLNTININNKKNSLLKHNNTTIIKSLFLKKKFKDKPTLDSKTIFKNNNNTNDKILTSNKKYKNNILKFSTTSNLSKKHNLSNFVPLEHFRKIMNYKKNKLNNKSRSITNSNCTEIISKSKIDIKLNKEVLHNYSHKYNNSLYKRNKKNILYNLTTNNTFKKNKNISPNNIFAKTIAKKSIISNIQFHSTKLSLNKTPKNKKYKKNVVLKKKIIYNNICKEQEKNKISKKNIIVYFKKLNSPIKKQNILKTYINRINRNKNSSLIINVKAINNIKNLKKSIIKLKK